MVFYVLWLFDVYRYSVLYIVWGYSYACSMVFYVLWLFNVYRYSVLYILWGYSYACLQMMFTITLKYSVLCDSVLCTVWTMFYCTQRVIHLWLLDYCTGYSVHWSVLFTFWATYSVHWNMLRMVLCTYLWWCHSVVYCMLCTLCEALCAWNKVQYTVYIKLCTVHYVQ